MGNPKFILSGMIPNAWLYKLKAMSRTRSQSKEKNRRQTTPKSISSLSTSTVTAATRQWNSRLSQQMKSYYLAGELNAIATPTPTPSNINVQDPPRKSPKNRRSSNNSRRRNRSSNNRAFPRLLLASSVSAGCSCRATLESVWAKTGFTPEDYTNSPADDSSFSPQEFSSDRSLTPNTFDGMVSWSVCSYGNFNNGVHINMDNKPFVKFREPEKLDGLEPLSELHLPPIKTYLDTEKGMKRKEANESTKQRRSTAKAEDGKANGSHLPVKVDKEDINGKSSNENLRKLSRKSSVKSPGMKLRTNSPRIGSRKIQSLGRKSVSSSSSSSYMKSITDSFAVVKSSQDPQRDFEESMVEMIVENNIKASKDLEELLTCYLLLNSEEYHDLIIKVFRQIWFDITQDNVLK